MTDLKGLAERRELDGRARMVRRLHRENARLIAENAQLRAVVERVRRHTHQGIWAMTRFAGDAPEDDCLLCRDLVVAGVLTLDQIGTGTRAALDAGEQTK